MHDAFRHARGAGGEHDVKRMIEGRRSKRSAAPRCAASASGHSRAFSKPSSDGFPPCRERRGSCDARQFCQQFARVRETVDLLPLVKIAVGDDEQARLDLAETIQHALRAEIRRGGRPDRADAGGRQHTDRRFRPVMDIGGDAVAGLDAFGTEKGGEARHALFQFAEGDVLPDAFLAPKNNRKIAVRPVAQQIFGEIQPGIRKPFRPGHLVAVDQNPRAFIADDLGKIPYKRPELFEMPKAPSIKRGIVESEIALPAFGSGNKLGKFGQSGFLPAFRRRFPKRHGFSTALVEAGLK